MPIVEITSPSGKKYRVQIDGQPNDAVIRKIARQLDGGGSNAFAGAKASGTGVSRSTAPSATSNDPFSKALRANQPKPAAKPKANPNPLATESKKLLAKGEQAKRARQDEAYQRDVAARGGKIDAKGRAYFGPQVEDGTDLVTPDMIFGPRKSRMSGMRKIASGIQGAYAGLGGLVDTVQGGGLAAAAKGAKLTPEQAKANRAFMGQALTALLTAGEGAIPNAIDNGLQMAGAGAGVLAPDANEADIANAALMFGLPLGAKLAGRVAPKAAGTYRKIAGRSKAREGWAGLGTDLIGPHPLVPGKFAPEPPAPENPLAGLFREPKPRPGTRAQVSPAAQADPLAGIFTRPKQMPSLRAEIPESLRSAFDALDDVPPAEAKPPAGLPKNPRSQQARTLPSDAPRMARERAAAKEPPPGLAPKAIEKPSPETAGVSGLGGKKEPWQMTDAERSAEIARIKSENKAALATPLMSEGGISPTQLSRMSERQRAKWRESGQERMRVESQLRDLENPSDAKARSEAVARKAKDGRILQLTRRKEDILRFGVGKNGKLKPSYASELAKVEAELNALSPDLAPAKPTPEPQGKAGAAKRATEYEPAAKAIEDAGNKAYADRLRQTAKHLDDMDANQRAVPAKNTSNTSNDATKRPRTQEDLDKIQRLYEELNDIEAKEPQKLKPANPKEWSVVRVDEDRMLEQMVQSPGSDGKVWRIQKTGGAPEGYYKSKLAAQQAIAKRKEVTTEWAQWDDLVKAKRKAAEEFTLDVARNTTQDSPTPKAEPQGKAGAAGGEAFTRDEVQVSKPITRQRKRANGTDGEVIVTVKAPSKVTNDDVWDKIAHPDRLKATVVARIDFHTGAMPSRSAPVWSIFDNGRNYIDGRFTYAEAIEKAKAYVHSAVSDAAPTPKAEAKAKLDQAWDELKNHNPKGPLGSGLGGVDPAYVAKIANVVKAAAEYGYRTVEEVIRDFVRHKGRPITKTEEAVLRSEWDKHHAKPNPAEGVFSKPKPPAAVAKAATGRASLPGISAEAAHSKGTDLYVQSPQKLKDAIASGRLLTNDEAAAVKTFKADINAKQAEIESRDVNFQHNAEWQKLQNWRNAADDAVDRFANESFHRAGMALQGQANPDDFSFGNLLRGLNKATDNKPSAKHVAQIKELSSQVSELEAKLKAAEVARDIRQVAPRAKGSTNKIFTQDKYQAAIDRINKAASGGVHTTASILDPQSLSDLATIVGFHIESGARSLADIVKRTQSVVPSATHDDVVDAAREALRIRDEAIKPKAKTGPTIRDLRKEIDPPGMPTVDTKNLGRGSSIAPDLYIDSSGKTGIKDPEVSRVRVQLMRKKAETRAKLLEAQAQSAYAQSGLGGKAWTHIRDLNNISRTLLTTLDNSIPLRQGYYTLLRDPKTWAKGWMRSWKGVTTKGLEKTLAEVEQMPRFNEAMQDGTLKLGAFTHTPEEGFLGSRLIGKFPGVKNAEHMAEAFQNYTRMVRYQKLADTVQMATGQSLSSEQRKLIAQFVNSETGAGHLPNKAAFLNELMFSAKFAASRIENLVMVDMMRAAKLKDKALMRTFGREYLKSYLGMTALTALAIANGASETDTRSSGFGKIKVGDFEYDLTAGTSQYVTMFSRLAHGALGHSTSATSENGRSGVEIAGMFAVNKLTPVPRVISYEAGAPKWMKDKNPDRLSLGALGKQFMPIHASSAIQQERNAEPREQILVNFMLESLGINVGGKGTYSNPDEVAGDKKSTR